MKVSREVIIITDQLAVSIIQIIDDELQAQWILSACCVSMEACQKRLTCQEGPTDCLSEASAERKHAPGRRLTGQELPLEWP